MKACRMKALLVSVAVLAMLPGAARGQAQQARADLPAEEVVRAVLDNHPVVEAALARVDSARAAGRMLAVGPHEITLDAAYARRDVLGDGMRNEYDATLSRAFRLPGKAALDRQAGRLGVEVAENRMKDVRHQAALLLGDLWHDWLTAAAHHGNDQQAVAAMEEALDALRQRVAKRDAAELDVDQARAALERARAQAGASRSLREGARAVLLATFPDLPLPLAPPELAAPTLPAHGLERMRDRVIEHSHEILAAEREAARLGVVSRRASADRIADPSLGVRLFREQGGRERGAGVVASIPLGGGYRRAAAAQASAEANAARLDLANVERQVTAVADADLSNALTRIEAWESAAQSAQSADAALARITQGYRLGGVELADLLYQRRQAQDARGYEIDARSAADRALLKLAIDSHSIWIVEADED